MKRLSLAWMASVTAGPGGEQGVGYFRRGGAPPAVVGGLGPADGPVVPANIKGTPLMIDGTLYVTTPDNAWAMDARDGRELWHYFWRTRGGTPIANRGAGMWHNKIYMVTPDNYLVSLESTTGRNAGGRKSPGLQPAILLDGCAHHRRRSSPHRTGSDLDYTGYLQSLDPDAGEMQWRVVRGCREDGDPNGGRWPAPRSRAMAEAIRGCPVASTIPTRTSTSSAPAIRSPRTRPDAVKATTCKRARSYAVNVDAGKIAWHFQTSPHDMHDWDSGATPILIDAVIKGKPRKLRLHARATATSSRSIASPANTS